jgi:hypothetical protein
VVEREKVVEAELLRRVLGETLRAGWVDGVGWDWEAGIGEEREVSVLFCCFDADAQFGLFLGIGRLARRRRRSAPEAGAVLRFG